MSTPFEPQLARSIPVTGSQLLELTGRLESRRQSSPSSRLCNIKPVPSADRAIRPLGELDRQRPSAALRCRGGRYQPITERGSDSAPKATAAADARFSTPSFT